MSIQQFWMVRPRVQDQVYCRVIDPQSPGGTPSIHSQCGPAIGPVVLPFWQV